MFKKVFFAFGASNALFIGTTNVFNGIKYGYKDIDRFDRTNDVFYETILMIGKILDKTIIIGTF